MKHALITGGASGIGAATACRMADAGIHVTIACLPSDVPGADALAEDLRAQGRACDVLTVDVSDPLQVEDLFSRCASLSGSIDILVNSAGVDTSRPVSITQTDNADIERIVRVNVMGTMFCCREAVRRMSTALGGQGGCIVNVSSMASTIGGRVGKTIYGASKGAVDAFTKGLAREAAPLGVRVNAVRPGATRTPMVAAFLEDPAYAGRIVGSIPLGRIAESMEVAEAIHWLASDAASFVSGALLDVSGGGFSIAS
ncbi:SDR family oxidoreductase [Variovorax dokdonensis]|uniref:SDR family oxidoreductase n=1 Tax=Variovorax dokdonensis TaxID=344883 RepID=A0ABT7N7J8_9BURK|nr:SDR family oxidoreductase [Variovorax dokdonensis]MDM0043902.1 SDR family oxidoreductase [Variovorax dokdonensis]